MGAMAGYGIKAYLVCQSLNHITRAYGRDNVILDNCHIVTAFAAADMTPPSASPTWRAKSGKCARRKANSARVRCLGRTRARSPIAKSAGR